MLGVEWQSVEGTDYYLPKTMLRFTVKVEKTQYTPGQFAKYAMRYIRQNVSEEASTSYRVIGLEMDPVAVPDTTKHFTLQLDKKHSITDVTRAPNGRRFSPAARPKAVNPADFMTADILNASNTAKMAELTAQEIYDIRDSRSQLAKGEADYMPKDGEQLKTMLRNLDTQEQSLTTLFTGIVVKDTTWTTIDYLPVKEGEDVLFRFSKRLGLVDADDYAGTPYYIEVADEHSVVPAAPATEDEKKKKEDKNDIGLRVNQPSKMKITVVCDQQPVGTFEAVAPQFGTVESLSGELFGKKQSTRLVLDPLGGSVKTKITEYREYDSDIRLFCLYGSDRIGSQIPEIALDITVPYLAEQRHVVLYLLHVFGPW